MSLRLLLAACASACALTAAHAQPAPDRDLEARFDAMIDPAELGSWIRTMAAAPTHVGSEHGRKNAEMTLAQFRSWGWDAKMETYWVLYPTPISTALELVSGPGAPVQIQLTEPAKDQTSAGPGALPAYVAFQGDGDVTAPLVYVNYGMPADYDALERMGVSVRGKIVIARYGQGWRGLKPKLAQDHGAVGAIIYSDPRDDGYSVGGVYPEGPMRPPEGLQRGSVADMTVYAGDPLTPGYGATRNAKRLDRSEAQTILKIPTLPIAYGQAEMLLRALDGPVAPPAFRGSLPITYRVGGGEQAKVRIAVKSDWSLKPAHNVIARLKGREKPNEWVIRGNHRDGWVYGASDPLSGHAAMMGEAKAMGELVKSGWRPKRTIVYTSWDAEEPMLLGSTEWAEDHAAELKKKAVIYINSDTNGRGFLGMGGSHEYQRLMNQVAADVVDPQTKVSVRDRLRARTLVASSEPGASEALRAQARAAADPARDLPLSALGSGSDYSTFLQHLGLPAINIGFGGEGEDAGVYHSAYDTYEHHSRFVDPGHAYAGALAKTAGRLVIRLADADLPPQRYGDVADTVAGYLDEVKRLADQRREESQTRARLLAANAYNLADDPTEPHAPPPALAPAVALDFRPLEAAVAKLKASAGAYDAAIAAKGPALGRAQKTRLDAAVRPLDQALLREEGLPFRPWYKHMLYAPGRFTGYGAKTLPGVREAIEERRYDDAQRYIGLTAQAISDYASGIDRAAAIVDGR
ncbi:M20/M25/M40 family metallo-hydrolase [Phenylobacterium sp.]|jgi:N-acetylated-alpha-linked acidic dipeptidase|uniref:M20/M25/M40 family metallo-hydrolase n=1 Tax=Phenylobacterium sp. TaxID=1871053 RepID=UPI002F91FC1B